jgi:hypothetical protein
MRSFREGDRLVFQPTPASLVLYSDHPPLGAEGVVTEVSIGNRRVAQIPGPGGGLVYVEWDGYGLYGVSTVDVARRTP